MNILDLARPEIRGLQAYSAAEQVDGTIRLNANEAPQTFVDGRFRRPLNRYPEVRPSALEGRLTERFRCKPGQLLVTRGSSEAIDLLIRTFCRAGVDSIAMPTPSFSMYKHYATIQGAEAIEVETLEQDNFGIDIDRLLSACKPNTRAVFVCSPNNPTGTPLERRSIEQLASARATSSIVVVDEAYIEFGDQASVTELLDQHSNLVILRTLSKALGFAGARCGAVIASSDIISLLAAVQAPYALSTPVVECVEDALQELQGDAAVSAVAAIVNERERLADALNDFDFVDKVWPSAANFLLVRFRDGASVVAHCLQGGILLRSFGSVLPNCIRITVGSNAEIDALLQALHEYRET